MFSKINHVASCSERYALLGKFYETVFGLKSSPKLRPGRAVTVGDGYVGFNINPRRTGRGAGLDHFGIQVQNMDIVFDRMRSKYPTAHWIQRPATRPFAAITANDPDGNVFDLSQKDSSNRAHVYTENDGQVTPRHISHVAIRTMRPDEMAKFYVEVFELTPQNKAAGDPNHYLSDGHVTLMLMPYDIRNYVEQQILLPGIDHVGFTVESIDKLKDDLDEAVGINPQLNPIPFGGGKEGKNRLELLKKQCPIAEHFMSDPDYNFLAVRERQ
ncbi:MAG TPA: VOC family protein [Alphaproteobacteria bacterium]|jgi:predicted enzyme related to lactoylglutathione lyase|nr:VOC family protein [Alphaproteobacteria bacterium]